MKCFDLLQLHNIKHTHKRLLISVKWKCVCNVRDKKLIVVNIIGNDIIIKIYNILWIYNTIS